MGKRKTNQIIIVTVCLLIAIIACILQVKNWKNAEPFRIESIFMTED